MQELRPLGSLEVKTEECRACERTGKVHDHDVHAGWSEVPCPACVKPRTRPELEDEVRKIREALDAARQQVPAWRMV
jgi:hypothetical protein